MEYLLVGILTLFGWFQYERAEHWQDEAAVWEDKAARNEANWKLAIEVNKNNAITIADLRVALKSCNIEHRETIDRVNVFQTTAEFQGSVIAELERRVAGTDFNNCRVPDWVDFSTP